MACLMEFPRGTTRSPSPTSPPARIPASRIGSTPIHAVVRCSRSIAPRPWPYGWTSGNESPENPTLRSRLRKMPPLEMGLLWPPKDVAITNLEHSLAENRPRALIQMATGSGKTLLAAFAAYRLVKFAGAKRVLFLVDRANLGRQTMKEFQGFTTPDDGRKFTELYNLQRLSTNVIDPVSRVTITTIQRLYSIMKGEPELDEEIDEHSCLRAIGA